jgi:glycosyltransferase involved in cell wall biosynthesis
VDEVIGDPGHPGELGQPGRSPMRFHLLALPNAQTTRDYSLCGFTMCTIRFAELLKELGHTVFIYASEENEAPCDELIQVITKEEQKTLLDLDNCQYQNAWVDERSPIWQLANPRMAREIAKRKKPGDFICGIGGVSQAYVSAQNPDLQFVEYSVGYKGSFSPYRVFESYAWKHYSYGMFNIEDVRFFDEVIPCFFDEKEFPFKDKKEKFALYVGRLIERKGVGIACQAAHAAGIPLKIIGHGDQKFITHGAEYLGVLPMNERNEWMSKAMAMFAPTTYIEPFNCAAVEAQLCGTPVISTDAGGLVETVEHGKTGFRCSYLGEFVRALEQVKTLDPNYIRARAVRKYSLHNVKHQYQRYFERLYLLWGNGWNTID